MRLARRVPRYQVYGHRCVELVPLHASIVGHVVTLPLDEKLIAQAEHPGQNIAQEVCGLVCDGVDHDTELRSDWNRSRYNQQIIKF